MKADERHRLKHDAYAESVWAGLGWVREHQTQVLLGVAVVLLIAAIAMWTTLSRQRVDRESRDLLGEVERSTREVYSAKGDKQLTLVKNIAARCDVLAADYPGSDVGGAALLRAGQLYAMIGKYQEAASYFGRVLDVGPPPGLGQLARREMAEALEGGGQHKEALAQYGQIVRSTSGSEKEQAEWDVARCEELLGNVEAARKKYGDLASAGEDSPWRQLARSRLSYLANPPKEQDADKPKTDGEALGPVDAGKEAAKTPSDAPAKPRVPEDGGKKE